MQTHESATRVCKSDSRHTRLVTVLQLRRCEASGDMDQTQIEQILGPIKKVLLDRGYVYVEPFGTEGSGLALVLHYDWRQDGAARRNPKERCTVYFTIEEPNSRRLRTLGVSKEAGKMAPQKTARESGETCKAAALKAMTSIPRAKDLPTRR